MLLGLPVWKQRVAPVFDTIISVKLFDYLNFEFNYQKEINMKQLNSNEKIEKLLELNIEIFICGAISFSVEQQLIASGITVIPFISGDINTVLLAYKNGNIENIEFKMPGCKNRNNN